MRRIFTLLAVIIMVSGIAYIFVILKGGFPLIMGYAGGTTHQRYGLTTDDRLRVVFEGAPDGQAGVDELNDRLDRLGFHMTFEVCAEDFDRYVRAHIGEGMIFVPQSATPGDGLFKELLNEGLLGNLSDQAAVSALNYLLQERVGTCNDPRTLYFMPIWLVFDGDQSSTGAYTGKTVDASEFLSFLEWVGERDNYDSFFGG